MYVHVSVDTTATQDTRYKGYTRHNIQYTQDTMLNTIPNIYKIQETQDANYLRYKIYKLYDTQDVRYTRYMKHKRQIT